MLILLLHYKIIFSIYAKFLMKKEKKKSEKSRHIPCLDWFLHVLNEGVHREGEAKLNR